MKTKLYLVATLIEHYDQPPTDTHSLYADFTDAKKAMQTEIEEGMENFNADKGDAILDLNTAYEWRDEDGNGLTVVIEEMEVN